MFCRNIYRYHGRTTDRLTGVLGARDTCVSKNSVTNNFINIVLIKFYLFLVSMAIWEMHCNGITEGHSFPLWALCLQQNPLCLQQNPPLFGTEPTDEGKYYQQNFVFNSYHFLSNPNISFQDHSNTSHSRRASVR